MVEMDVVWQRIQEYAGEVFHLMRGGEFRYSVQYGSLRPDRTNRQIPKGDFAKALQHVPLVDTVPLQRLQGPSYIYAVLMDRRIREGWW